MKLLHTFAVTLVALFLVAVPPAAHAQANAQPHVSKHVPTPMPMPGT